MGFFEGVTPNLLVADADFIRSVLVKDFDHFINRRVSWLNQVWNVLIHLMTFNDFKVFRRQKQIFPENDQFDPRWRVERSSFGRQPHLYYWQNQASKVFQSINFGESIWLEFNSFLDVWTDQTVRWITGR